jgi:FHA domain-containing protein/zinc ribbon protein
VSTNGMTCPSCNAKNEAGWSFCQQCGKRLSEPQPSAPPSSWKSPDELRTHETEQASEERADDQMFKTVATEAPETDPDFKPAQHLPSPAVAAPSSVSGDSPTIIAKAPASPPIPAPVAQTVSPKPAVNQPPPMTDQVQAASAGRAGNIACPQCGQTNDLGIAFCASCGAPVGVARTVVMASQGAPLKGRLSLVMEGGQSGEVYDLGEETIIGRTAGSITFPHDGFMSGRHARIIRRGGAFVLADEGSRNGTFIKIKGEVELKPGDMILVGKQLFRFEA